MSTEKPAAGIRWLRTAREIRDLRRDGVPVRGSFVFVRVASVEAAPAGIPGVAVVTTRGFKGAVARNRAKRRVRGAVLENRDLFTGDREYLLEARPGSDETDYQNLVIDLREILSRVGNCTKKRRTPGGG